MPLPLTMGGMQPDPYQGSDGFPDLLPGGLNPMVEPLTVSASAAAILEATKPLDGPVSGAVAVVAIVLGADLAAEAGVVGTLYWVWRASRWYLFSPQSWGLFALKVLVIEGGFEVGVAVARNYYGYDDNQGFGTPGGASTALISPSREQLSYRRFDWGHPAMESTTLPMPLATFGPGLPLTPSMAAADARVLAEQQLITNQPPLGANVWVPPVAAVVGPIEAAMAARGGFPATPDPYAAIIRASTAIDFTERTLAEFSVLPVQRQLEVAAAVVAQSAAPPWELPAPIQPGDYIQMPGQGFVRVTLGYSGIGGSFACEPAPELTPTQLTQLQQVYVDYLMRRSIMVPVPKGGRATVVKIDATHYNVYLMGELCVQAGTKGSANNFARRLDQTLARMVRSGMFADPTGFPTGLSNFLNFAGTPGAGFNPTLQYTS